jgi:hypothetical protein
MQVMVIEVQPQDEAISVLTQLHRYWLIRRLLNAHPYLRLKQDKCIEALLHVHISFYLCT